MIETGEAGADAWHALALSEEVSRERPLGVNLGPIPIVLFRDSSGAVRALEDRCIHRRVPLSLGKMTPDGMLQCGYHGWTYEGATGRCRRIPNFREGEPVPPSYQVPTYHVAEQAGFVLVSVADADAVPAMPAGIVDGLPHHGSLTVAIGRAHYLAALLDDPRLLLDFPGARITDHVLGDVGEDNGVLVAERGCVWPVLRFRESFVREQPLRLRTTLHAATGFTTLALIDADERAIVRAALSIVPGPRGTTSVRWRAAAERHSVAAPLRWRIDRRRNAAPITLHDAIDGAALAQLMAGPSKSLERLAPTLSPLARAA